MNISGRKRAKPAGGMGEVWIDEATAVPLMVRFEGALAVADGPTPSKLEVKIDQSLTAIGKDVRVQVPKDAIDEIKRTKMPVRPRELFEQEGIVAPLPRDAGPGGGAAGSKPSSPRGEIPDEE